MLKYSHIFISLTLIGIIWYNNLYIPLTLVSKLYEISITVSSILFGVLGIWLSSIYSEGFKLLLESKFEEKEVIRNEIKILINPLLCSIISIILGLLFFIGLSLAIDWNLQPYIKFALLKISTSVFIFVSFFQIKYLGTILYPIINLEWVLNIKNSQEKNLKNRFK